ncbi:MAG TPA: 3-oxoacyl-ACP reductase family protein [Nitrososphaerales archaeon]|nr:3-oxoacyl-ACP reductase family protein [Nitrososphaerales archaeon]
MNGHLTRKVCLITGAARGIGQAVALLFAREGATVAINYSVSKKDAENVVGQIRAQGGKAVAIGADVADRTEVASMVMKVKETFGTVDVLVNNAGILLRGDLLSDKRVDMERMFQVNVMGVLNCTREVAKVMIPKRSGKIVNIASNAGIGTAFTGTTYYAATKAAVITLTKRFAFELGKYNLNVNCVAPGFIDTNLNRRGKSAKEFKEVAEIVAKRSELGRIGTPEDIANVVFFLASEQSSFVTGQTILADGGRIDMLPHSL